MLSVYFSLLLVFLSHHSFSVTLSFPKFPWVSSFFIRMKINTSVRVSKEMVRIKIRHYHNLYVNRPDPIAFLPGAGDTSGRLYDDFIRLFFLHPHREESDLTNELEEESDQFRFFRVVCFANLKGAVGLIMVKSSTMRISIPLDLSSRSFILTSSHTSFCPFPRTFSSVFCLNGTCWVFILAFHWFSCLIIVFAWHFPSLDSRLFLFE